VPFLGEFTFKVAEKDERVGALDLRREVYAVDWPGTPIGKAPVDELDKRADLLIALDATGLVLASCRVLGPDQRPFDFEQFVDLSPVVSCDRRPALVGRMCVRHSHRVVSRKAFLPLGMLKLAHDLARKRGFSDFVMFTFPHLVSLYRSAFFRPVGITFEHPAYRCQSHVMHLDLLEFRKTHANSVEPFAQLLLATDLPNVIV